MSTPSQRDRLIEIGQEMANQTGRDYLLVEDMNADLSLLSRRMYLSAKNTARLMAVRAELTPCERWWEQDFSESVSANSAAARARAGL